MSSQQDIVRILIVDDDEDDFDGPLDDIGFENYSDEDDDDDF